MKRLLVPSVLNSLFAIILLFRLPWSSCIAESVGYGLKIPEEIWRRDVDTEAQLSFQPFRLKVEPTYTILNKEQALQITQDVEHLMNEFLSSFPSQVVGAFQYLKVDSIVGISFNHGSASTHSSLGSDHDANESSTRAPSCILQMGGIQGFFTNGSPLKKDVREMLQSLVNSHDFAYSSQITSEVKFLDRKKGGAASASPLASISKISLLWESEYRYYGRQAPTQSPAGDTNNDPNSAVANVNKEKKSTERMPIFVSGASLVVFCFVALIERGRRKKSRTTFVQKVRNSSEVRNNSQNNAPDPGEAEVTTISFDEEESNTISVGEEESRVSLEATASNEQGDSGGQTRVHSNIHIKSPSEGLGSRAVRWASSYEFDDIREDVPRVQIPSSNPTGPATNFVRHNDTISTITEYTETSEDTANYSNTWMDRAYGYLPTFSFN